MSVIKPFKAVRPRAEFAEQVAALPYDVMSSEEAKKMVLNNPYSFLHIDKAEIDFPFLINGYDDKVYEKAAENFCGMREQKIFIQDDTPKLYIYRQIMDGRTQTGLVACSSVDEYLDEKIKKHELTRKDKEMDRIKHMNAVGAHTGPIFLAYKNKDEIPKLLNSYTNHHEPLYDFISDDSIEHMVWCIDDEPLTQALIQKFAMLDSLYIADGHHRTAAAAKVALAKRKENPNFTGDEEFNFFLSVIFPHDELYIMEYNRLVRDLNRYSVLTFLNKLRENFAVSEEDKGFRPQNKNEFGLYIEKKWYKITAQFSVTNNAVDALTVSILQNEILSPLLNIKDIRTDDRIDFVGGGRGVLELANRVDAGEAAAAFTLFPTTMEELMMVADENEIMPPKSTWFEPKLRSGLFIHLLSD